MKSVFRVLAFLSVVTVGAFGLVSRQAAASSPVLSDMAETASPYGSHCARCHGADGRANTAKGRELDADDLTSSKVQGMSAARLTKIIKKGKGDMPAFPGLSKAQISSIIRTVKSF